MAAPPTPVELHQAEKRLRAELEREGMLLAHDVLLPSATRCVAGQSISGSWWAHPSGALIYAALQRVEGDVARVKLVGAKSTLVHRRLWPALARAARCAEPWQRADLDATALELLRRVEGDGSVDGSALKLMAGGRAVKAAQQLEARLLVFCKHGAVVGGEHKHRKTLIPFEAWQREANIADGDLPDTVSALEALSAPLRSWVGTSVAGLLPWLQGDPRARKPRRWQLPPRLS